MNEKEKLKRKLQASLRRMKISHVAKELGLSRPTFNKRIHDFEFTFSQLEKLKELKLI